MYGDASDLPELADLWTRMADVLTARAHLHLREVNIANCDEALPAISSSRGFTSTSQNAEIDVGAASVESPWFAFNTQQMALEVGDAYVDLVQALNDPRELRYAVGFDASHLYFTATRPVPLIGFAEQKFIEAECRMRTEGATVATHQAYLDGIAASFSGLSGYASYVGQAAVDPGQANLTMFEIMAQKYIALFADPEVFTDWRRTMLPPPFAACGRRNPAPFPISAGVGRRESQHAHGVGFRTCVVGPVVPDQPLNCRISLRRSNPLS